MALPYTGTRSPSILRRSLGLLALLASVCAQAVPRLLEDADLTWLADYSVHYEYCFHSGNVVSFRLCPQNACEASCRDSGEYLMEIGSFTSAFIAAEQNLQATICENILNDCQNDDDSQCYESAEAYFCMDDGNDGTNIDNYLSCQEIGEDLYVGPYCGNDNQQIHLGAFVDEDCSEFADDGAFEEAFGFSLPYGWYTEQSVIGDECVPCQSLNENEQVLEQCTYLYQGASSKCEASLNQAYTSVDACEDIEQMKKEEGIRTAKRDATMIYLMLLFAVALALGLMWYFKMQRAQIERASSENLI